MSLVLKEANGKQITDALKQIAARTDGRLIPADVLEAARDPASPLHPKFEWDDTKASENYRLIQAGLLIRKVRVHVMKPDEDGGAKVATVRAYASLPSSRAMRGGYEPITEILSDTEKREELVNAALADIERVRQCYENVSELAEIWEAANKTKAKVMGKMQ